MHVVIYHSYKATLVIHRPNVAYQVRQYQQLYKRKHFRAFYLQTLDRAENVINRNRYVLYNVTKEALDEASHEKVSNSDGLKRERRRLNTKCDYDYQ